MSNQGHCNKLVQSIATQVIRQSIITHCANCLYSGTSLIRSHTGLGKSDLNGEVTILEGAILPILRLVKYNLGLSKGDRNSEMTLLVR